jgi:hypothetical protein
MLRIVGSYAAQACSASDSVTGWKYSENEPAGSVPLRQFFCIEEWLLMDICRATSSLAVTTSELLDHNQCKICKAVDRGAMHHAGQV